MSTRTDIVGVISSSTTLIFQIDGQSLLGNVTKNVTVVMYRVSSDVRCTFSSGLIAEQNYTFRSRVINNYGASDYSINSVQISISGMYVCYGFSVCMYL